MSLYVLLLAYIPKTIGFYKQCRVDANYGFVLLSKFYSEDAMKEGKMGGACSMYGREKKCNSVWAGNLRKETSGRLDII